MPDDLNTGSTADSPTAGGDDEVVDAGSLPDDLREEILDGFRYPDEEDDDQRGGGSGEADGAGGQEEQPDGKGDDDTGDTTQDGAGSGDDDGGADGGGEPDPEEQELDQAEQQMGRKQRRAFAGLRKSLKEARTQLEESQEHATFGKTIQGVLEENQITPEQFRDTLALLASRRTDPLKAIKGLKGMLDEAAEAAKGEYPEEAVAAILGAGAAEDGGGRKPDEVPLEELDEGLAQAVDYGLMTEEKARALLAAGDGGRKDGAADGGNAGGDDDGGDAEFRVADQEQLVQDLEKLGYYEGLETQEQYVERIQEELIPRAIDIAEELSVDIKDPNRLQSVMLRAAKELTAERRSNGNGNQPRKKPPVSQRRGSAKRKPVKQDDVPTDDKEFRKHVLAAFQ